VRSSDKLLRRLVPPLQQPSTGAAHDLGVAAEAGPASFQSLLDRGDILAPDRRVETH